MFQAQNIKTINRTLKVAVSHKIVMTTSVARSCITKQNQNCKTKTMTKTTACKTKTKTETFLVSDRSCPKTDGLRTHHCSLLLFNHCITYHYIRAGLRWTYLPQILPKGVPVIDANPVSFLGWGGRGSVRFEV